MFPATSSKTTPSQVGRPIRPIPNRAQNISFSNSNTKSADIIRYALNNNIPSDVHKKIMGGVKALHPAQLDNLLNALKSVQVISDRDVVAAADNTRRHCVRCHKGYFERHNGIGACEILHQKPEVIETAGPGVGFFAEATNVRICTNDPAIFPGGTGNRDASGAVVVTMKVEVDYKCCGMRTKVGTPVLPCFVGRHTTRPVNVDYEKKNVPKCEYLGCFGPRIAATPVEHDAPAGTDVTQA
ncbi:hypothetical protein D9615_010254 [Tricholomella constricta]|uniref:Uncharacterized protein n=1 Tax=Tricholomella constricta TaxID=117010 RepID=A0A8H5GRN2_9AGAR|nr:hypothetical protein D9615_010254 [Tricholomella constricta]